MTNSTRKGPVTTTSWTFGRGPVNKGCKTEFSNRTDRSSTLLSLRCYRSFESGQPESHNSRSFHLKDEKASLSRLPSLAKKGKKATRGCVPWAWLDKLLHIY